MNVWLGICVCMFVCVSAYWKTSLGIWVKTANLKIKEQQTFFPKTQKAKKKKKKKAKKPKTQKVNILFWGHVISVNIIQLCFCTTKPVIDNAELNWLAVLFNKTLLTK